MDTLPDRTRRDLSVGEASELLARTPRLLDAWLRGLPDGWLLAHEGGDSWHPVEVVEHLILAERNNWMPRVRWLLEHGDAAPFAPFTRMSDRSAVTTSSLPARLDEFAQLRRNNLSDLAALGLDDETLGRRGRHPALGRVTLREMIAAWVVHDMDHVTQIARVLASQYADAVGPYRTFLRVISGQPGI